MRSSSRTVRTWSTSSPEPVRVNSLPSRHPDTREERFDSLEVNIALTEQLEHEMVARGAPVLLSYGGRGKQRSLVRGAHTDPGSIPVPALITPQRVHHDRFPAVPVRSLRSQIGHGSPQLLGLCGEFIDVTEESAFEKSRSCTVAIGTTWR